MQKVKKYLKIAETIKSNVSDSDPEVALYLAKALEELGENFQELKNVSQKYNISANGIILDSIYKIKNELYGKSKPIEYHLKGYLGGAAMLLLILGSVHIYIQSEKIRRNTPLYAKFSPVKISYYCNQDLTGEPCKTDVKNEINADWRGNAPIDGVPSAPFSARFETCLDLGDKKQEVFFSLGADDGYRAILDGKIFEEKWEVQGFEPKIFSKRIDRGKHKLVIEYFQGGGASRIELKAGSHRGNLSQLTLDDSLKSDCT